MSCVLGTPLAPQAGRCDCWCWIEQRSSFPALGVEDKVPTASCFLRTMFLNRWAPLAHRISSQIKAQHAFTLEGGFNLLANI